jgi:CBS domain-containing protein
MRVAEIMTRNVYTVREWEELGLSSDLMRFRRFRHLPVVDAHRHVVGMVSRLDLVEQASKPGNPRLMPVYDVMKRPAITIGENANVDDAAKLMNDNRIHSLPVVDRQKKLVGILTDTDLLGLVAGQRVLKGDIGTIDVGKLMTVDPITLEADATIGDAATTMLEGGFRHLPVIDAEGTLVGMISERDLRTHLGTDFIDWSNLEQDRLEEPLSNLASPNPVIVRSSSRLSDVLDVFTDDRIGAVAVLDADDRLVGILSYVDILVWLRDGARASMLSGATSGAAAEPYAP